MILTTMAEGRFSANGFFVLPDKPTAVEFIPFEGAEVKESLILSETLRVEHLYPVMHPPTEQWDSEQ